tara:strand:+ start:1340 stop:2206 length:867 start_codon:yes stop_codon:yes gene_type:complete
MAYKMRSGNKPQFKSMGSSPARSHNVFHKDPEVKTRTVTNKSDDGIASVDLKQVNVNSAKGFKNTDTRLPIHMPGGGNYDPNLGIATNTNAERRKSKQEAFKSDVGSFIDGLTGIPEDIVEGVADAGGWVAKGIGNKVRTIKANRIARKQDKIDNPKPKKVKKEKVATNKNKKSKRKSKVDGIDPTNDTGMVTKVVNGVKTSVKAKDRFNDKSSNRVKKTKPKSKVAKNLGKALKGTGGMIGEQLITQGIGAGIQALLTPKEKEQRDRSNPSLSGFSQMKFGRRKMKE